MVNQEEGKIPPAVFRSTLHLHEKKLREDPVFLRVVAEHIAGMTEKYLMQEYKQLFHAD